VIPKNLRRLALSLVSYKGDSKSAGCDFFWMGDQHLFGGEGEGVSFTLTHQLSLISVGLIPSSLRTMLAPEPGCNLIQTVIEKALESTTGSRPSTSTLSDCENLRSPDSNLISPVVS
jgi:hypothetical protein